MRSSTCLAAASIARWVVTPLLLGALVLPTSASAQDIVPGGSARGGNQLLHEYQRMIDASVDTLRRSWEAAASAHDIDRLANLYATDALLSTSTTRIQGVGSVKIALAQWLDRSSNMRISVAKTYASGDQITMLTTVSYDVAYATGGSYPRSDGVTFVLSRSKHDTWQIQAQAGGGLPVVKKARELTAAMSAGQEDTIFVKVRDVAGTPVDGALVGARLDFGEGDLEPSSIATDKDGNAMLIFRAGARPGRTAIRVTASVLPEEPLFFNTVISGDSTPGAGPQR